MDFFKQLFNSIMSGLSGAAPVTKPEPICPHCNKKMDRNVIDFMEVFSCSGCDGVWLSQDTLVEILRTPEQGLPQLESSPITGENTYNRSDVQRVCTNCDVRMDNYQFDYSSGIWIDACPHGHGIWLDSGEIRLIREFRQRMSGALTSEEKEKMAMALLDGATKTRQNLNKIEADIRREQQARNRHGKHPGLFYQ